MQSNGVGAADHAMYLYFLMDAGQVFLADVRDIDDLARVDLLAWIHSGADSLLFDPLDILQKIGGKLGFADFTILSFT